MRIEISAAQLEALEAAAAGVLVRSRRRGEAYDHWRIESDDRSTKPVTRTASHLLARGLITQDPQPCNDGAIYAIVTALGRAVLDELADRGPDPKDPSSQ